MMSWKGKLQKRIFRSIDRQKEQQEARLQNSLLLFHCLAPPCVLPSFIPCLSPKLAYFNLNIEAFCSPEMLTSTYETTWWHNSVERSVWSQCCTTDLRTVFAPKRKEMSHAGGNCIMRSMRSFIICTAYQILRVLEWWDQGGWEGQCT
jgi:hypothetical protein